MPRRPRPWWRAERGAWYACVGGKQVWLADGRTNRKEAEKRLLELLLARQTVGPRRDGEVRLATVIDQYLARMKSHWAPSTYRVRAAILQRFAEHAGYLLVSECRPLHLSDWIDQDKRRQSPWSKAKSSSAVKSAMAWAVKQQLIPSNPFAGVSYAGGDPRAPMADGELAKLFDAANPRERQLLVFLSLTGCRPGEARQLRWDQVDWQRQMIVMQEHKTRRQTGRGRVVILTPAVIELLQGIKRGRSPHVFLSRLGSAYSPDGMTVMLRRLSKRAGVTGVTLYGLRHRFGTRAITRGVDIKTLAVLMGHSTDRDRPRKGE